MRQGSRWIVQVLGENPSSVAFQGMRGVAVWENSYIVRDSLESWVASDHHPSLFLGHRASGLLGRRFFPLGLVLPCPWDYCIPNVGTQRGGKMSCSCRRVTRMPIHAVA